jgi:hypothetical protein
MIKCYRGILGNSSSILLAQIVKYFKFLIKPDMLFHRGMATDDDKILYISKS